MDNGETDINGENRWRIGDYVPRIRLLYRILWSFMGGAIFLLGALLLTTYLFSISKPNDALVLGIIFMVMGISATYFFAYRPR